MTTDKPTLAQRLARQAADAAELRALATNPDVVALRVEKVRRQVDVMAWTGIVLGLGFTMTNVQQFAAAGAVAGSLAWWAAWLLDPMVSLLLIALLRTEQVLARWQVRPGRWVPRARWFALTATYLMNTWTAWVEVVPSLILLHSVPVLVVAVGAEAITDAREALTEAIYAAARATSERAPKAPTEGPGAEVEAPVEPVEVAEPAPVTVETVVESLPAPPRQPGPRRRLPARPANVPRRSAPARSMRLPDPHNEQEEPPDTRPAPTGTKRGDARAWAMWKWSRGDDPLLQEVNDAVGSDSLVKRAEFNAWREEFDRGQRPSLTSVQ